jgi:hypothetical protein
MIYFWLSLNCFFTYLGSFIFNYCLIFPITLRMIEIYSKYSCYFGMWFRFVIIAIAFSFQILKFQDFIVIIHFINLIAEMNQDIIIPKYLLISAIKYSFMIILYFFI